MSSILKCSGALWLGLLITGWSRSEQPQPVGEFVFGYAGQQSYVAGEELTLHLSSSAAAVDIVIERLGKETRVVDQLTAVATSAQPIPDRAPSDGCSWPASYRMPIPTTWSSGYYQASMSTSGSAEPAKSSLYFIVRSPHPGRDSKILLQLSTNTYNAYTNWGGHSLYAYHDRDGLQGHRVSFARPQTSQFKNWELPFVQWAESKGYRLDYAANNDLEFHPEILSHYRLVLSVGHDEYWSSPMRDSLEKFIGDGGNVAFFSGNTCCWQVRAEDQGQALTCWKQAFNMDPLYRSEQQHLLSTAWSHHLVGRPENQLTGVGFLWGGYHRSHDQFMDGAGGYEIHRPEHWIFADTGLKRGDLLGSKDTIVGYECDGCEMKWSDGLPQPTGADGTPASMLILGTCPARWAPGDSHWYDRFPKDRVGAAVLGLYTRGGTVFTAGSTDWAHGLRGNDPTVERITSNILDQLAK